MKKSINYYIRFIVLSGMISLLFTGCLSRFDVFDASDTLSSAKERVESGEDINAQDSTGKTILFAAAETGKLDIVEYLVENGANVNLVTDEGISPLIIACEKGHFDVIKHLVENGADINYQMENNNYALYQLVGFQDQSSDKDYLSMVKYMVEKGANYKMTGFNNYTLLHASRDVKIIEYLRELGMDIHALTENNATALVGSIANNGVGTEVTKYFIDNCVDLEIQANFDGKYANAYRMAVKFNRLESAALIEEAMKNPPAKCIAFRRVPPLIEFYNFAESSTDSNATVGVKVTAQTAGIGKIKIFLNDKEIEDIEFCKTRDDMDVKGFNIKLNKISDSVKVYAYDEESIIRSSSVFHTVPEVKVDSKPKLYAVVIGIDTFKAKELDLKYAEADSVLFGSSLFKRSKDLYSEVNVIYLKKEEETTKEAILKQLKELQKIDKKDIFVFYVATQATIVNDKYYMATSNVSSIESENIVKNGLSEDDLRAVIEKIPAANKVLLFDTNYSDLVSESIAEKIAVNSKRELNIAALSAVNSTQTSLNNYGNKHGIFSYVLSDALDGEADSDDNGIVDSAELVEYVIKTIPLEAEQYKLVQVPVGYQHGFVFDIAKVRDLGEAPDTEVVEIKKEGVIQALAKIEETVVQTLPEAEKSVQSGKFKFRFKDSAIYLNIKDNIKDTFYLRSPEGEHQIVFDFDSESYTPHFLKNIDTDKVSKVEIGFHQKFYRVVFYTKTKQYYEYKETADGIEIILKGVN